MSTSKIMQKPVILGIDGATIQVAHPNISKYPRTQLAAQIAASGVTMTVSDNNGFEDNDWFIVGEIGDNRTEEGDVNGAVTRGTSLTVTNTLKFAHELDSPVTRIQERGIKIYGAATDGGAGTLIASVDAITTPIADAVSIQWDRPVYSEYTLISTDTTYAYYFVKFTDGTTDSAASDYIPATGWTESHVIKMIEHALDETDSVLDDKNITLDMCVKWANECQQQITQYKYQDPVSGHLQHVDWDFEVVEDTSLTVSENEIEYALSGMTTSLKYTDSDRAIISVKLGSKKPLQKITIKEFDEEMENKPRTELAAGVTAGDTSITVDSNVEFEDSGTLYIGSEEVTYTGKTSTDTFTGIPASGTGSFSSSHSIDDPVWQNVSPDLPTKYTIFNGKLFTNKPIKADYENYPIKIRGYKALDDLTEASDQTEVSFSNVFHLFIQARIERRKGNEEKGAFYLQEFDKQVLNNALANDVPIIDNQTYYNFISDDNLGSCEDASCDCCK
jgi:hypothetical protein